MILASTMQITCYWMVPTAAFMGHVVQPGSWSPQKLMPCAGGEEDLGVCTLNAELLPSAINF